MSIYDVNDRFLARMGLLTDMRAPDPGRVADGLRAANEALTLAERLAVLFRRDPKSKAARLRGRAARLLERAKSASPRRAAVLGARAAGLLAEAAALEGAVCGA